MFVLIWAVLLLSMRGLADDEKPSPTKEPDCCKNPPCITPDKADITAEAGLCVVIPCTVEARCNVKSIIWHKCNKTFDRPIFKFDDNKTIESEYKGRVSLMQPDLSKKNCSIIINNLTKSDSGLYYFTVTDSKNGCKTLSKKSINVTDPSQKPTMVNPPLTGGQKATLTCTSPDHIIPTSPATKTPKDQSTATTKFVACNDTEETCTKDLLKNIISTVQQLHGIAVLFIGFLLGMLPSAIIACLVIKCLRKKQRRFRSLPENMELVIAQSVPDLMDVGLAADYDVIRHQDAADGGAEASGPSVPDGDARPKEVEYSNIDFSAMKRRNPAGAEQTPGTAETEYAEIKRGGAMEEERLDDGGEDGGALGGNEEEMAVMIGEDEEAKQDMAAIEDGDKDAALYSNVNEVMDEV